jgi:hypothetical protein
MQYPWHYPQVSPIFCGVLAACSLERDLCCLHLPVISCIFGYFCWFLSDRTQSRLTRTEGLCEDLVSSVANLVVQLSLVAAAFDDPVFFSTSSGPPLLLHLQKLQKELSMSYGGSSHWNRMQTNDPLPPQDGDEPAQESVAHPRNMYAKEQIATFSSLPVSCDPIHISCLTSRFFVCMHSHPFPAILNYLIHAHISIGYFQTRC